MKLLPRISLLTLLLVMTCLAMGIALWQTGQDIIPMRETIRSLRKELGQFDVQDPSFLHVQRGKTITANAWKWRLFLPTGKDYTLYVSEGEVPDLSREDLANWLESNQELRTLVSTLESGQYTLEMALERHGGHWWASHVTKNEMHGLVELESKDAWYSQLQGEETYSDASYERVSKFSNNEPVVILSIRRGKREQVGDSWIIKPTADPADSLVIWIKPSDPNQGGSGIKNPASRISQE